MVRVKSPLGILLFYTAYVSLIDANVWTPEAYPAERGKTIVIINDALRLIQHNEVK